MTDQPALFDAPRGRHGPDLATAAARDTAAARAAADEAITRVDDHADPEWKDVAAQVVEAVARANPSGFTTDDVWARLDGRDVATHEPRALGAVMRRLQRERVIRPTPHYRTSVRPQCHGRPVRVWMRAAGQ